MGHRLQSQQSLSQKQSPKSKQANKFLQPMQNPVLANPSSSSGALLGGGSRSRERMLREKELRKQAN